MLSTTVQELFDQDDQSILTKNRPLKATGTHVSIIGHVTETELRRRLDQLNLVNGFINRFLIILVRRSRSLPLGGNVDARAVMERPPRWLRSFFIKPYTTLF